MPKQQQIEQDKTLVKHPRTKEVIDISGLWEMFEKFSSENSFYSDLENVKQNLSVTSRRIFEFYKPETVMEFKDDIRVFLLLGDFIQSIKVYSE